MVVPVVSVIVPVRDDAERLRRCLDRLAEQQGAGPAFEVVVVDNGSRDASVAVAAGHPVGARVVREPAHGSYAARNAGAAVAAGAVLAFTDADCRPAVDWVRCGAAAVAAAGILGGPVRSGDGPAGVCARYDRAVYLRQDEHVREQGFAATANLWVRRDVWAEAGPFDAALRSSGDLEWCRRATARTGVAVTFDPHVLVEHEARSTVRQTWLLHRRLGAGWAVLARRGQWPSPLHDGALRLPLGHVVDLVAADRRPGEPALRRRQLGPVHAVAMTARWAGRLTGR